MSRGLAQFAVVLIVFCTKSHSALQKETVSGPRAENEHSFLNQNQDEISVPKYELEEDAIDEQLTTEFLHETAWTKSGKRRVAIVKARHRSPSTRKIPEEIRAMPKRTKRKIFGRDNRVYIPRKYTQKFPFNATVKISTGCTGTLVSPRHVLTSAHCIHSGKAYEPGYQSLSIGFLRRNASLKWVAVSHTYLPNNWTSGQDTDASKFDYAILKLSKKHNQGFMSITLSEGQTYGSGQRMHFSAFEDDKPVNTMWYRHCYVKNATTNMLFHCCDAKPGSSGAGVYVYFFDNKTRSRVRKVIGVFSGNRFVYDRPDWPRCRYGYSKNPSAINYNVAIRINSLNLRQMCRWMEKYGGEDCRRFLLDDEKRKRRRRRRRRNRHKRRNGNRKNQARSKPVL